MHSYETTSNAMFLDRRTFDGHRCIGTYSRRSISGKSYLREGTYRRYVRLH